MNDHHHECARHRDVKECVWPPVMFAILNLRGVSKSKEAHQPQEEERLGVVGNGAAVRVDHGLQHKCSNGQYQRHHLLKTSAYSVCNIIMAICTIYIV